MVLSNLVVKFEAGINILQLYLIDFDEIMKKEALHIIIYKYKGYIDGQITSAKTNLLWLQNLHPIFRIDVNNTNHKEEQSVLCLYILSIYNFSCNVKQSLSKRILVSERIFIEEKV